MTASLKLAATAAPLILAESTFQGVRSSSLGELLVGLAALLLIGKIMWDTLDRVRGASQKREVSMIAEYATAREHRDLALAVEKLDHERRTSVANLHEKIDNLSHRLDARIDEIPGRTIALLSETKQLHKREP